jgi:hypothetical protein
MVQFCSNSVTGTIIAPAFALVWVFSSMRLPYASRQSRQHGEKPCSGVVPSPSAP